MVSYRKLSHSAFGVNNGLKLDDITRTRLRNELHLYTDGSKNEHGLEAAFVAYIDGHEIRNRTFLLDRTCSVFQAELFGIEMALMWATSFKDPPWNRSVLHSDNRCSLKWIKDFKIVADFWSVCMGAYFTDSFLRKQRFVKNFTRSGRMFMHRQSRICNKGLLSEYWSCPEIQACL